MKKYTSFLVVLLVVFMLGITTVQAEIQTRAEAKVKMEALRANLKSEKDAAKLKIKEARLKIRENTALKLDQAVERLSNLAMKINTKIDAVKSKGMDVSTPTSFMITADTKLTEAKKKIAEVNIMFSTSIEELSNTTKDTFRITVKEINILLRESHQAMTDAVKALRASVQAKIKADAEVKTEGTL